MYSVNPQTSLNTFHSSVRNMIITNGVGLSIFGLSVKNIPNYYKILLTLIAYLFILISVFISYMSARHLKIIIEDVKNNPEAPEYYKKIVPEWNYWYYMCIIYGAFIFIIGTVILISKQVLPI